MPPSGHPDLKLARLAAGHPVARQAAARVGMRPQHLLRLEKGGRGATWATMHRVITGLGLGLEWFFSPEQILEAAARLQAQKGRKP